MQKIEELANYYVAYLRAIYLTHQNSHWITKGANAYGNHLLFERAYNSAGADADGAAEKMLGVFGEDALDPSLQTQFICKIMEKHLGDDPIDTSLRIEKDFLTHSENLYNVIKREGAMTLGLDNFIQQIADNREVIVYLLQQANKSSHDKFAARKAILTSLAQETFNLKEIQQKLVARLFAIVPSYVPGTYTSDDITVVIDVQNRKIWGTVKLPNSISSNIQDKIQNNFKQFAINLLPANMQDFVIGVGFVILVK